MLCESHGRLVTEIKLSTIQNKSTKIYKTLRRSELFHELSDDY